MKSIIALVLLAAAVASQARDVQRLPAGTAVLSGIVIVDELNGTPIRRVSITVVAVSDSRRQYLTSTDDRGRFSIGGLPPGNVRLVASKPGYVQTYHGARSPGSTVGLPIALTNDRTVDVTVRMPRGSVIAGVVTDENGQPMPGVGVRVQRVTASAGGQRTYTSQTGALIPSTDDRGAFRFYGLPAGDYIVSIQARLASNGEVRPTTTAETQWAERQLRNTAGTAIGSSADSASAPPPAQTVTYGSVYFPGTTRIATAGIVSLAAGQERNGVDLKMQFVPTARIDGVVLGLSGQPAPGIQVSLLPKDESAGTLDVARLNALMEVGLLMGSSVRADATGTFSLAGVEPGSYIVLARNTPAGRGGPPVGSAQMQWAMTDVEVNGRDITGLSLRLANGLSVSGRLVFEGRAGTGAALVTLGAQDARGMSAAAQVVLPGPADTFEITGLTPASYRASARLAGWTLKSITIGGRDVTDVPITIQTGEDLAAVTVTFTDAATEVSGRLYDGADRPTADLSIVLFATDRSTWFSGSRWVRPVVRPATDGRFTFGGLAPGEYYLAAVTDATAADLANAEFLQQLVPAAIRITVAQGEKKIQDLKIAK